jgi:predicted nucleic acid-binding protein
MKSITALIDTNIPIDNFDQREPFRKNAEEIFKACEEGRVDGYMAAPRILALIILLPATLTGLVIQASRWYRRKNF